MMTEKTKTYLVWGVLAVIILLPRIALLANGLDAQRIWDTNTSAAFEFLQSAGEGKIGKFLGSDQKYPLLGSYLYVPVIGAYYAAGRALQWFDSPDAFADAFAVGDTHVFFWLRLEVLLLHLGGLALVFLTAKRFTGGSLRAGVYALVFAATDFYLAMFSVTPRIHSVAFVGAALALYAAFLLLEEKSLRNYLLAFGAAGVAASLSQSGFPALILPLLAHALSKDRMRLNIKHHGRELLLGAALCLFIILFIGYPRFWFALRGGNVLSVFLSGEHSQPVFGLRHAIRFRLEYIIGAAFGMFWAFVSGFWYVACSERRRRIRLAPHDVLAIAHIALFGILFTFSDVMSGRFMLAVLPSFFFLCARVVVALEKRKGFLYAMAGLLAVQAAAIGMLTMLVFGGDTRAYAAAYVLANTNENDKLFTTMDAEILGITPAPHSVPEDDAGMRARRIRERDLRGEKTRQISLWRPGAHIIPEETLAAYRYIIVSSDDPERYLAEEILTRNNFHPAATFFATRNNDYRAKPYVGIDTLSPVPRVPYLLKLRAFRSLGPTVVVYERK